MRRFIFPLAVAVICGAVPALAQVPQTMSYQGVLTDGSGNLVADGPYNFSFKIYDVASAGAPLWTESQPGVSVVRGGFSVILGSVTPITLAFDKQYWLGIAVGGGPELTPRVQLASAPYGLSLRLPFAGSASSAGPALSIKNTDGGADIAADHRLDVGSSAASGNLNWYMSGVGTPTGLLYNWYSYGGAIDLRDQFGSAFWTLQPDIDGGSAYLDIPAPGGGFLLDGNRFGGSSPYLSISGPGSSLILDTNVSGDAALSLPASSVDAGEILDEPGIAQGRGASGLAVPATMTDFTSVTITTPAAGYIVLSANATHYFAGNGSNWNYAYLQISETSGGALDPNHDVVSGAYPTSQTFMDYRSAAVDRTYFKGAGTYTFYFQGLAVNPAALTNSLLDPALTATYFPTSYGTVTTVASGAERAEFSHAEPVVVRADGPIPASSDGALVDLRELELKATRARVEAERAERQLIEARARQQLHMVARPATAPKK